MVMSTDDSEYQAAVARNKKRQLSKVSQAEPPEASADKILLYFHGNSEDVGHNIFFLMQLRELLGATTLAMEYPGYGMFTHKIVDATPTDQVLSCSARKITQNAEIVMEHVLRSKEEGGLGYKPENVIVFGRSIGTGPASQVAAKYKPGALLIMSPYTSIKGVAANVAGRFLSMFI